jgi:hypothetical protein
MIVFRILEIFLALVGSLYEPCVVIEDKQRLRFVFFDLFETAVKYYSIYRMFVEFASIYFVK